MNKPEIKYIDDIPMVNIAWIMETFEMNSTSSVSPKMKSLKVRGTKISKSMYYPLNNIKAALTRQLGA